MTPAPQTRDRFHRRFPHLAGSLLTFVADDDVWVAPLTGGPARRISATGTPAANPRLSRDGSRVAWTARTGGAPEVFVADTAGGDARQRTWWGNARTRVRGWADTDTVLAVSSVREPGSRSTWAYRVPVAEGAPERLPLGTLDSVDLDGPDGAVAIGSGISREPSWWKRYRGGTTGKLWVRAGGQDEFTRLLADTDGHLVDVMWVGRRIAFLADHEGHGNVYSVAADGTDLRRHTDHEGFYARHAATDGRRVVYERAGDLWLLDGLDAEPRPLDLEPLGSGDGRRPVVVDTAAHLRDVAVDRTGRGSAVVVHGTVHWLTHRDGPVRALAQQPGVHARLARPVDGDLVLLVDDADGEETLRLVSRSAVAPTRTFPVPEPSRFTALVVAPDASRVAVSTEDGVVRLLELATGAWTTLAQGRHGPTEDLAFAPDSAWVAWAEPTGTEGSRSRIRLSAVDRPAPVDVTDGRFLEEAPAFLPDGSALAFLSHRSFDPVYDTHRFDLGFPASTKPVLAVLAATTPSPFGPAVDGADPVPPTPQTPPAPGVPVPTTAPRVHVDLDGVADRLVSVPVAQGDYRGLRAVDGALLWGSHPMEGVLGDGRATLTDAPGTARVERFDLRTRRVETLVEGVQDWWVSGDGARLVLRDDDGLRVVPTTGPVESDAADSLRVDLGRVVVRVDPVQVWTQAFDEDARLLRDFFWLADMSGVDWPAVVARYRPLVAGLGSYDDFVDLLWELHGELGTSHAYVQPRPPTDPPARQGLLGADLVRVGEQWQVERVLPGEPSAPQARSPLRAPGVGVRAGDAVLAVNGAPVGTDGLGPLLTGTAGHPVELTVSRGDEVRRVAVVPLADEEQLRYQAQVQQRRAHVRAGSDGRYGYLHVPDMMAAGWAQLHRDLDVETGFDALVVDVRGNRGGHTSQLVAELIGRRVLGWDHTRTAEPGSYPAHASRGPVVVLADEWAGSDGDIITQVVKLRGIGPVVGTRTWGGVIGIDGRYSLADGTGVTQPRYSFWFADGVGWSVEGHGVDPDVEVPLPPHDEGRGADPQLDRALQVLADLLVDQPTSRPPGVADRPDRSVGPLPPR